MKDFSRTPRPEKVEAVNNIKDILDNNSVILTDFNGIDVEGMASIRKKLRETNGTYKVVKNTLLTIAASGTPAEAAVKDLAGSTAIAYSPDDPVALAKALTEFTKGPKPLVIKCGYVEGAVLDKAQVTELSTIPSRLELIASIIGGVEAPLSGLVGTLNSMLGDVVWTLEAIIDQKEKA